MLELGFVRGNLELVEEKLRARGADPAALLGDFRALDESRRVAITNAEQGKAQLNRLSQQIGELKKSGQDAGALMEQVLQIKKTLEAAKDAPEVYNEKMRALLSSVPNLTRDEVPMGKSEADNLVVKTHLAEMAGRSWDFAPRPHWELGEALGMLDLHTARHGYTEVLPPFMVNSKSLFGTGQLPKFAEDLFRCSDTDADAAARGENKDTTHWLIPTAEVPVTNLYRDEILDEARLPIRLTAYTPCFRAEAGAAGKDTRGIIRQHQFQKVELVKFTRPEESDEEHERLTRDAEEVLEALGLPSRRVFRGAGDPG